MAFEVHIHNFGGTPSGASTGSYEAVELRGGGKRCGNALPDSRLVYCLHNLKRKIRSLNRRPSALLVSVVFSRPEQFHILFVFRHCAVSLNAFHPYFSRKGKRTLLSGAFLGFCLWSRGVVLKISTRVWVWEVLIQGMPDAGADAYSDTA